MAPTPERKKDIYMMIRIEGYRDGQVYSPVTLGNGGQSKESYDHINKKLAETLQEIGFNVREADKK